MTDASHDPGEDPDFLATDPVHKYQMTGRDNGDRKDRTPRFDGDLYVEDDFFIRDLVELP
jgi:hypothetical protein